MPMNTPVAEPRIDDGASPPVLEGLPSNLQKQTLLRIDFLGLARRNAKEQRVELVHIVKKPTPTSRRFSGDLSRGIVELIGVPPRRWNLARRIDAVVDQPPKRVGVPRAGIPTAHAHDRQRRNGARRLAFAWP